MKLIFSIYCILSLLFCSAQEMDSKFKFSFGIDYLRTSQLKLDVDKNKIAPYFSLRKNKFAYGLGFTTGKKNIVLGNNWSNDGKFGLDGGFAFIRFYPINADKIFNPYLETNYVYFHSRAFWGTRNQSVHTTQHNLKLGCQINITNFLSANLSFGVGIARNVARQALNILYDGDGGVYTYNFYRPISFSGMGSVGLKYKF